MFIVQKQQDGSIDEIAPGSTITFGDIRYPWQVTEQWTDDELEEIQVWRVSPAPVPEGKVVTSYSFVMGEDGPVQVADLADAPPMTCLYKRAVWTRSTDEEAEAFRSFLDNSNARDWGLYNDATMLDTTDEDFPKLRAGMIQALTSVMEMTEAAAAARIDTILAPEF